MGVRGQVDNRPLWPYVPVDLGPTDRGGLGQVELMFRNSDLQALDRRVGGLEKLEGAMDSDPLGFTPAVIWHGLRHYRAEDGGERYTEEQVADVPSGWLMADQVQDAIMAAIALAFGQDPGPALEQARAERAHRARLAELVADGATVAEAKAQLAAEAEGGEPSPPVEAPTEVGAA
jgi:hypothetical protein